jgi:hypothetical protein
MSSENKDKIETYLAFGATRFEACKPIATDALRLALTPNINQMRSAHGIFTSDFSTDNDIFAHSVLGIIAIPGMMTGAILGGSSVQQAARLQMVIMFMISSCTALASITTTVFALSVVVDNEHRVRTDRIDNRPHAVYRARDWALGRIVDGIKKVGKNIWRVVRGRQNEEDGSQRERERLLG